MEGREERARGGWSAGGVPTPPLGGESNNSQKHINLNTMKYYSDEQGVDGGTFIALLFLFRCLANETKYTSLQLLGDRHENGLLLLLASPSVLLPVCFFLLPVFVLPSSVLALSFILPRGSCIFIAEILSLFRFPKFSISGQ